MKWKLPNTEKRLLISWDVRRKAAKLNFPGKWLLSGLDYIMV